MIERFWRNFFNHIPQALRVRMQYESKKMTWRYTRKKDKAILHFRIAKVVIFLGKIIKCGGRVKKNAMFDRIEMVVNSLDLSPNPEDELKKLNDAVDEAKKQA